MSLVLLVPYFCPHIAFFAVPYLATATSFAVDARILTCHNLHIVASDGNTCGTIITRKAAKKMKARVIKKKKKFAIWKKNNQEPITVHPKSIHRALLFEHSDVLQPYSKVD